MRERRATGGFAEAADSAMAERMAEDGNIYLIGARASGKSSVGRELAARLDRDYLDLDEEIEARLPDGIAGFVLTEGWPAFRALESEALLEAAKRSGLVVATGGGAVLDEGNRRAMRESGRVVYLEASAETLAHRLAEDPREDMRPSLTGEDPAEEISAVLRERRNLYLACAHEVVESRGGVRETALAVLGALGKEVS
jgi:shikimate kinase